MKSTKKGLGCIVSLLIVAAIILIIGAVGGIVLWHVQTGLDALFTPLEESAPWFFAMMIMLVCAFAWAFLGYIPKKWLLAVIPIIVVVILAGLFVVPEDSTEDVQQIMLPVFIISFLLLAFFGVRHQKRHNKAKSYPWQARLIKMGRYDIQDEIAYYSTLPHVFDDFLDAPKLTDGDVRLVLATKHPADPEKGWVPMYEFDIYWGSERIGDIRLRVGFTEGMYYSGHIGYAIKEAHRGKGYALRACRLLVPVARYHAMTKLLITNDDSNLPSYRVCEKLGAKFIRKAELPTWHDMYEEGHRYMNIFEWDLESIKNE